MPGTTRSVLTTSSIPPNPPSGTGVWAVIVAAGRGERLGTEHPKAFAKLGDRPLLAESLERLDSSDWIEEIVVVAPAGWEEPAILLAEELGCSKVELVRRGRRDAR